MTLPGVGAGNGNYATPANTSLGSIGLGYIYTEWLAQIDYTTPDLGGFKATIGVFDPIKPVTQALPASPESEPGLHGKLSFKRDWLYLARPELRREQSRSGPQRAAVRARGDE